MKIFDNDRDQLSKVINKHLRTRRHNHTTHANKCVEQATRFRSKTYTPHLASYQRAEKWGSGR